MTPFLKQGSPVDEDIDNYFLHRRKKTGVGKGGWLLDKRERPVHTGNQTDGRGGGSINGAAIIVNGQQAMVN